MLKTRFLHYIRTVAAKSALTLGGHSSELTIDINLNFLCDCGTLVGYSSSVGALSSRV
jgi:hypothetical protein